jgi:hypothetical protein
MAGSNGERKTWRPRICPLCRGVTLQVRPCEGGCGKKIYLHQYIRTGYKGVIDGAWWKCVEDVPDAKSNIVRENLRDSHPMVWRCRHCAAEYVLTHHE